MSQYCLYVPPIGAFSSQQTICNGKSFTFQTRSLAFPAQYLATFIHPHFSLPLHFIPFVAL
ncbi:hypothetical protein RLOC_00002389 [Lonchura striata]|uniref:Uncharacterized protein n=1 Tax=Lonchura striata TaxID=40157 RepID=A0A218UE74_9PASE|nr:hypothetical protein RLOC_00002389 [Lonchura striata domestica]